MKNAMIFHGADESPDSFWYPYIKSSLENKGYRVWVPSLPDPAIPDIEKQLPFVLNNGNFNEETIVIGHSAGCPLVLSVLEETNVKVKKVLLVSGFIEPLNSGLEKILKDNYDWGKIKANVEDLVIINSDNDPWGCDDRQGKLMFDKLGGTLVIRHGEGHMGSKKFNQPYKEFPFLLKFVD